MWLFARQRLACGFAPAVLVLTSMASTYDVISARINEEGQGEAGEGKANSSASDAWAAGVALQALLTEVSGGFGHTTNLFCDLLLARGDDEALGEGEGRGAPGPRAAASVAVALSKVLWRCQGRIVGAMRGCNDHSVAKQHDKGALAALCAARAVLMTGAWVTPFGRLSRGGERASVDGQQGQSSGEAEGEQEGAVGGEGKGGGMTGGGAEGRAEGRGDEEDGAGPSGSVHAGASTGGEQQGEEQQHPGEQQQVGVEGSCGGARSSGAACGGEGVTSGAKEQQQQLKTYWRAIGEQEQLEMRRRVWVCACAAWRCLPGLAGLARQAAAEGLVPRGRDTVAVLVWEPLLLWVKQLCCRHLRGKEAGGLLAGRGRGTGTLGSVQEPDGGRERSSSNSSSNAGGSAGCGDTGASRQGAPGGQACVGREAGAGGEAAAGEEHLIPPMWGRDTGRGSCGDGGGCDGCCGCWRDFLLRDVGVVELLGRALTQVAPVLVRRWEEDGRGEGPGLLWAIAEACVLLAAAFPEEVARAAWGAAAGAGGSGAAGGGGPGDDGEGSCSSSTRSGSWGSAGGPGGCGGSTPGCVAWPLEEIDALAEFIEVYEDSEPMMQALDALVEFGDECIEQGRAVGPSEQQQAALVEAAERIWCGMGGHEAQLDVLLLPPVCELRALLPAPRRAAAAGADGGAGG